MTSSAKNYLGKKTVENDKRKNWRISQNNMPQTTLTGKELPEDEFWAEGTFMESVSPEEMKLKERTIHMKNTEEMNYNCKQCSAKISAHNKEWHANLCDKCFDKMVEK